MTCAVVRCELSWPLSVVGSSVASFDDFFPCQVLRFFSAPSKPVTSKLQFHLKKVNVGCSIANLFINLLVH